ncbi:hypothetical protein P186_0108 [Pyrobaculum ferrireducens]|uniref:Uncharacterized protein n=1 Tax=Pyrobaculum ferrireducens TaxID=1104324 RepID=G7VEF2_9CREN|nr:hypothetical protein P186_0108 [Pyrobaculum ferrireducens]
MIHSYCCGGRDFYIDHQHVINHVARPPVDAVWTSRRKTPDGYYVVVLGLYARQVLGVEAEPAGRFYIYKTRSWQEVLRLVNRARALGLNVRL